MGNFDFLQQDKDYASFTTACIEAEKTIGLSTVLTAISSRRALELAVKWVYQFDNEMRVPYRDNLSSLVHDQQFKDILDPALMPILRYIIKLGNAAAHNNGAIRREEAVLSLRNLFQFIEWIDYCYGSKFQERVFNEALLPDSEATKMKERPEVVAAMAKKVDGQDRPLKEMRADQSEVKRKTFTLKRQRVAQSEDYHFSVDKTSEAETRKRLIDVDLRLAGWQLETKSVGIEVPVIGMPNSAEKGYVDYVLYGQNGLPLAVVEAKRTTKDPKAGRVQAELYAECLFKMTSQKPVIFYTNGFEIWLIEENYPPRKVAGFYTQEELQLTVDRRTQKKDLSSIEINDDITNRYYQKEAIISTRDALTRNQREALLVMATGSGKTRTAISLVDILTQANWVKNVLFLADRTSLVKQAYRNFNKLLPNLTLCNLLEKKDIINDPLNSRMVFSTYPTIMNTIDSLKREGQNRVFTIGHFDLIIIDESHRSIYQKYSAIFDYFDAFLVGLTATPREDVDRNTYELFNLENGVPTYAYDLEDAVKDKYLVSYRTLETTLKIPKEGIHYDDLSEEEKTVFDDTFEDEPDLKDIDGSAINDWLFNRQTIDLVLKELMEKGIQDSSGDDIGKTIIFAKNHKHAQIIEERFNKLFPEKGPRYAQVIDYSVNYYQSSIDSFSDKKKYPQIAISVDMLDTGIDIPEVVNLVFFKRIRSKIKFWQMIGRGTRLCEDLFGPGQHKTEFLIFDYGDNFEFFRAEKHNREAKLSLSLTQRLFNIQVDLIRELQDLHYQESPYIQYRAELLENLLQKINKLNEEDFRVRLNLQYVMKYKDRSNLQALSVLEAQEIKKYLSPLILSNREDELARRFDLWMFVIELATLTKDDATLSIKQVMESAQELQKMATVPQVLAQKEIIEQVQEPEFWEEATLVDLEGVRNALRDLIQFIEKDTKKIYYTNFEDEIISVREDNEPLLKVNDLRSYKEKVEFYIKSHADNTAVFKLYYNRELTAKDIAGLEKILWEELGSKEQYVKDFGDKPVPRLVREIMGVDQQVVNEVFSHFLSNQNLNAEQLQFVKLIVEYVVKNGYLEKPVLMQDPFKTAGSITQLFGDDRSQMTMLIQKIDEINSKTELSS